MLWLFGQIWVWLLIAFLLGAAVASLVFTAMNRRRDDEPTGRYDDVEDPVLPVEETEFIPATAEYDEHYEDPPRPAEYPPRPQNDWPPEDVDDSGHREGRLPPVNRQPAWRTDVEDPAWPSAAEEDWPR
jgi:hypothetical protein